MDESVFLEAIARDESSASRLMLADWLEENGESDRAEFIRVQCELTQSGLADERRDTLRTRELELLNAHRQSWIDAFGLPIEDVEFHGGLIARARLAKWDNEQLSKPDVATTLAILTELDLSGLEINDADLLTITGKPFPALRKLNLSNNHISDAGIQTLAQANAWPRLETLYLAGNSINPGSRSVLEQAKNYRLKTLDLGQRPDGYAMSPGEADTARREDIRENLLPAVRQYFQKYELLRSAMLCVAQYWADEADDAVHAKLVVSELPIPILQRAQEYISLAGYLRADPNVPNTRIITEYGEIGSIFHLDFEIPWSANHESITLWAAFSPEGGDQEYAEVADAYAPAVLFHRHGGYEFMPMSRPHLDGIRPEADE